MVQRTRILVTVEPATAAALQELSTMTGTPVATLLGHWLDRMQSHVAYEAKRIADGRAQVEAFADGVFSEVARDYYSKLQRRRDAKPTA